MHCIISGQAPEKANNMRKAIAALLERVPQRLADMFKGWVIQRGEYGKFAAALEREFDDFHARPGVKKLIAELCCAPKVHGVDSDYLTVKYLFSKVAGHVSSKELKEAIGRAIGEDLPRAMEHVEKTRGFPHAAFGQSVSRHGRDADCTQPVEGDVAERIGQVSLEIEKLKGNLGRRTEPGRDH